MARARRRQAPKTRRASETRALMTRRRREVLVAWAAERRSSKAGHTEATHVGWSNRACAKCGEKVSAAGIAAGPSSALVFI